MSGSWSTEETKTLNSIWGEESVQSWLDSAHQNRHIFKQIAREMSDKGYEKTWQQCRTNTLCQNDHVVQLNTLCHAWLD